MVWMKSDPYDVLIAIELSRATLRKMHQNLFRAIASKVIAFPEAGVFYPLGLSPPVAAMAMSGSSALAAVNALQLKRTRLKAIRVFRSGSATVSTAFPGPEAFRDARLSVIATALLSAVSGGVVLARTTPPRCNPSEHS